MLCRRLVSKEKAQEVSVEHVDPKKIYAVMEPGREDPMIITLGDDGNQVFCTSLSARPRTAHAGNYRPYVAADTPQEAIASFINWLLREKGRKIYEFSTLFKFCSWVIDLKQGRVQVTAPVAGETKPAADEEVKPAATEEAKPATTGTPRHKKVRCEDGMGMIHYANKRGEPVCGTTLTIKSWREVELVAVTCLKCANAFRNRTTAYYHIAVKR